MKKYKAKQRDELGSRVGTTAARVNKAMSKKWQNVETIISKTRLPKRAVVRRLHHGVELGIYEYERIIRFKLKRRK